MMALNIFVLAIPIFLMAGSTYSSFISSGVFESHGSTGRSLLQAKKNLLTRDYNYDQKFTVSTYNGCPVNLVFLNYTIITSQCKGPQYPAKLCCDAFKKFACPYADELNDMSNNCASIMFSYINLFGRYPPGLFANKCRVGKEGLKCSKALDSQLMTKQIEGKETKHNHLLNWMLKGRGFSIVVDLLNFRRLFE